MSSVPEEPLTSVRWTPRQAFALVLLTIALVVGMGVALSLPSVEGVIDAAPELLRGGAMIGVYAVLVSVVWVLARRAGSPLWSAVGLRRFPAGATLALGAAYAFAARFVAFVWVVALQLLGIELPGQTSVDVTRILPFTPAGVAVTVLLAAVAAPLAEEVVFRGILVPALLERSGLRVAVLASAALFAALHLNLFTLVPIFMLGVGLAWLYVRTSSLWPAVVAHSIFNSIAVAAAYALRLSA